MTYIAECKAPEIADLGATLLARSITGLVFHGRVQPESQVVSRLLTGYLLTTDKAVREYIAGRETLIAYVHSSNQTQLLIEGLGRFETCINTVKRAFRFLERIAAHPESPSIDRTMKRLLQNWDRRLTPIRDAVEHIDGDIAAEHILATGMAHLLAISHDGEHLEVAAHRLSLCDLATVIRKLHHVGCEVLNALPLRSQHEAPVA